MRGWFEKIKEEAGKGAAKDAPAFSAALNYQLIFAKLLFITLPFTFGTCRN
jgi:hypothetical protein